MNLILSDSLYAESVKTAPGLQLFPIIFTKSPTKSELKYKNSRE